MSCQLVGSAVATSWQLVATASTGPSPTDRESDRRSLLPKNQIHRPAAADVRPLATQVREQVGTVAARLLQRVGKDGRAVERSLLVNLLGQLHDGAVAPR